MVKKKEKGFMKVIHNKKLVAQTFLGVGLSLYLLNISSFLTYLPKKYSFISFDLSVFSSILIIIFAVWVLHNEK